MYTDYSPPAAATPDATTVPPAPPACYSTVAAAPIAPSLQKTIRNYRGRPSSIFFVLVPLLVAAMLLNGVFSQPDGGFSTDSAITLLLAAGVSAIWLVVDMILQKKNYTVVLYDKARINEAYDQGVVSTGADGRIVIAYDEVTALVETPAWLALFGKETEIVWSAEDLTVAEYQLLMQLFAAKLPQTVLQRKGSLRPRKSYETPITPPTFSPILETIPAAWSQKAAASEAISAMTDKAGAWFLMMSAVLSCALCPVIDTPVGFTPLGLRIVLTGCIAVLSTGIAALLIAREQKERVKAANGKRVQLHVLTDGLRIDDGANVYVIPVDKADWTIQKDGSRVLMFGDRGLTIAFRDFQQSRYGAEIFN